MGSVSAINATTVQVVLATAPTADLTVADAAKFAVTVNGQTVAAPTAVTKVASDLTGKTYKLTIATLNGQQGDVAVNGTKAAVATGMAYGFDFKAPSVTGVIAKGTKTVEVSFDEKLNADTTATTGNIIPANFIVKKVIADPTITTNSAVLSADGTKVTLTFNKDLTAADYTLILGSGTTPNLVNVRDVAGNGIYNATEISFRPTADQLTDTSSPALVAATYDKVSGKLTVAFSKNTTSSIDTTKLSINGVALTANDVAVVNNNTAVITMSSATKTSLNALTGALTLTSAAGAYTDGTTVTTGETMAITLQQPAVISTSSYDQSTSILTVTFDQPVTLNNTNVLTLGDGTGTAVVTKSMAINADGTANDGTVASATWIFDCTKGANIASAVEGLTTANLKAYIALDAVTNAAKVNNVAGQDTYANGVSTTYTAITAKPTLASAVYNNNVHKLVLTFSQPVNVSGVVPANIKLWQADTVALTGFTSLATLTPSESGYSKTLTYTIPTGASSDEADLALAFNTGKTVKVTLDANTVSNKAVLSADATTYTTGGVSIAYQDFNLPTVNSTASVTNQNLIAITFSKPVDATTAQTASNYVIKDTTGKQLVVTNAVLQPVSTDGTQTVYLTTATQAAGTPYTLTVNNVKDTTGNIITTTNTATFNGSSNTDVSALAVSSITPAAPANSKNDTLKVTFNAAVDSTSATNVANYVVLQADADTTTGWANATQVSLSDATAKLVTADPASVSITLGSANLQNSKYYKVVASNVLTSTGKALGTTNSAVAQLTAVTAPTAPTMTASQTAAGAIKLVFGEELDSSAATLASNYTATSNATPVAVTKATYSFDATTGKATVVLDLASAPSAPVAVSLNANVKNLAGVSVAGNPTPVTTLSDNVAPTVKSVVAKAVAGPINDVITVTFNDSDILPASITSNDFVVKDAQGNVIPSADYTVAPVITSPNGATITFDKTGDNAYNLLNGANYTVTITGVVDTSGNALASITNTATWDAATDKTAPAIATPSGLALTTGPAGTGNIKVTFNEDVDATTATNKANYVVKTGSTTLTPSYVTYASKVATVYFAEALSNAPYDVTVTNVKDLAGNIQTIANNQTLAAAATAVTAAASAVSTATGTTTVTLGQTITGLAAGDIVVKKGGVVLTSGTDYNLTGLATTSVGIGFTGSAALDNTSVITIEITKAGYTVNGGSAINVTNSIAAAVTASASAITTATGTTTVTLGQTITGLSAGNIVVKKGGVVLTSGTDYNLTGLATTSVGIGFTGSAALDNTSVITIEITKAGYTVNGGSAINVTNSI
ncbi:hypothetical protein B9W14_00875 [Clostridium drakei]|uniref:SbsA Ig-like domain-containing protein n=1 Tax=Clostridium drakei TaxID=332101 RepID=A0A2U8DK89_9CLOT|nr:hypothetical protein B9W14_00875 [Clostridium drakei]